jgi:hypothetical protein
MAIVVRSLPSSALDLSVPTKTITRSAALMSAWVCALSTAGVVAVVEVPAASKITDALGLAAFTAAVMPCTAFTCVVGLPE